LDAGPQGAGRDSRAFIVEIHAPLGGQIVQPGHVFLVAGNDDCQHEIALRAAALTEAARFAERCRGEPCYLSRTPIVQAKWARWIEPMFDFLIVGAGFAGSVLAERLASQADKKILLVDKRDHIGGNAYDHYNEDGILVHDYGPHAFHTNSKEVFDYLGKFTAWRPYEHKVLASVDGQLVPLPINRDTINRLYGLTLSSSSDVEAFFNARAEKLPRIRTSEDVVVSKVGRDLYEKFYRGYTRKMWGLDPSELDASVAARVPARTSQDDRYFADTYQAMPLYGYTRMFQRMLAHPNI